MLNKADRIFIRKAVKLGIMEAQEQQRKYCMEIFDMRYNKKNGNGNGNGNVSASSSMTNLFKKPDPYYILAIMTIVAHEVFQYLGWM